MIPNINSKFDQVVQLCVINLAKHQVTKEWSDWRCSCIWWIQSVYVSPGHRRKGMFSLLYSHVKSTALAAQACGLRLYADDQNSKAHATYEELGMTSHYKVGSR